MQSVSSQDYIYINIYAPGQKYTTTLKNEEKVIVYNFLIMKISYKEKVKWHLNQKYEEISIHFYMYISIDAKFVKFILYINIWPPINNKEKRTWFNWNIYYI